MRGGAFLSEGGYGCVFYPEINCRGRDTSNKEYISKIQRKDFSAENEIAIGNVLKTMKDWIEKPLLNNFAPVISTCPIQISKLSIDEEDKCALFKKEQTDDYIIMRVRYVDNKDFDDYLVSTSSGQELLRTFIGSYNHLLQSLSFLQTVNIVHNDLKGQNIIYDTERSVPIIIDFGLSIPIANVNRENINNYFYIFAPDYYAWALEVHFLNYILHVNPTPSKKDVKGIARAYTQGNAALKSFTPGFRSKFEDLCYQELLYYVGKDENVIIKHVLDSWATWDNYSLSVMFIKILFFLVKKAENGSVLDNPFVVFTTQLLLKNIHPNPRERLSVAATTKAFNLFLYNQEVDKVTVFDELIQQVTDNKPSIDRDLLKSRAATAALSRRIIRP